MVDTVALLQTYGKIRPLHGLPLYADYWDDGKKVFAPEYGILAVILFDEKDGYLIFGPDAFDVPGGDCSISIPKRGHFYICMIFPTPASPAPVSDSEDSRDIKKCFVLASSTPPAGGMINFFPLENLKNY